ncbi:hypothetical protein PI125_g723 [Phytophthora idaei]|nr:hypothetical protein PI125_g723 [Phytophthora idaei]
MALWLCSSLWMGTAAFAVVDASSSGNSNGSSGSSTVTDRSLVKLEIRSGIRPWVDPDTPEDVRTYVSSRGDTWELIMSDEFGDVNRNFTAGADHLWTSLEMPDGTNDALQLYSHDMTSVVCDDDEEGLCYLQIKSIDEVNNITVWNNYLRPPGYQNSTFYYRSGMLQTWNKFCFQGGMLEVRAKLPAVLSKDSNNTDLGKGNNARAEKTQFYPTWPAWGTYPPNPGKPCRGDGKDPEANYICDSFPMYMKIDYVRVYQDSTMAHECDPASHPTRQWILDHESDYVDGDNKLVEVNGGAPCRDNNDCNIPFSVLYTFHTGICNADTGRCECINEFWGGPRCTFQLGATTANGEDASEVTFGPPLYAAFIVLGIVVFLTFVVFVVMTVRRRRKMMKDAEKTKEFGNMTYVVSGMKNAKVMASFNEMTVATPSDNDDDSPEARRSMTVSGPYHRFR